jgi:hypothetical protein
MFSDWITTLEEEEHHSFIPSERVKTMSLSMTVGTLWAIVITVQLENSRLMTF